MTKYSNNAIIIKIDDHWFDVTEYSNKHPGGKEVLKKYHLKCATEVFNEIRGHVEAYHFLEDLEVTDPDMIKLLDLYSTK